MPHLGRVPSQYKPSHSQSHYNEMETNITSRLDPSRDANAGSTSTKTNAKLHRPGNKNKPASASVASMTWGNGVVDFSTLFSSMRKSKAVHSPDGISIDPRISGASTDTNSSMTSPCTTNYSLEDGDEEYDSGYSPADVCRVEPGLQRLPLTMTSHCDPSDNDLSIAEKWLSMGTSSNASDEFADSYCFVEGEEIEVSIVEYAHLGSSGLRCNEAGVDSAAPSFETSNGTQFARLNTTRGIFVEHLHDGGVPRSGTHGARHNDYPLGHSNDASGETPSRQAPESGHRSTSSHHSTTIAIGSDYTTYESTTSRDSSRNNKVSSSGTQGSNHRTSSEANRPLERTDVARSTNHGMTERDDSSTDNDDAHDSDFDYEDAEEEEKLRKEAALWKTAVDPKSGRSYYYHTVTRETQWRKPLCCASVAERRATIKKEKQTLAFFASMEQNILRSMQQQQQQSAANAKPRWNSLYEAKSPNLVQESNPTTQDRRVSEPSLQQPFKLVRTISTMEDSVLAALVQRVPSVRILNDSAASLRLHGEAGHGDSASSFAPFYGGHAHLNDMSLSSRVDLAPHHVLSPIQEVPSNDSKFWNSAKSSVLLQTVSSIDVQEEEADACENDGKVASDNDKARSPTRENSLTLSSVFAASRSGRHSWEESDCRLNSFAFIPEGENEDYSERSGTNHADSSPTRAAGNGLSRQNGFINLTKADVSLPTQSDHEGSVDSSNQSPLRQGLERGSGKRSLMSEMIPNEAFSRENSLDLAHLTDGSRRFVYDSSSEQEVSWGSYLSESAIRGLSHDEGEAMLELAAITDQMASIRSFSSSSSLVEDAQESSENIEPGINSFASAVDESNGMDLCDNNGWVSDPQLQNIKASHRVSSISSRPSMIRPTSLRDAPSRVVLEAVSDKKNAMMEKPSILRRNTCGTLYVGSTLSAPDKDATIKCVCAVYRAHILQSTIEECYVDSSDYEKYQVFNDRVKGTNAAFVSEHQQPTSPPSLEEISLFYRDVFNRAQMESDCIIISLIYVERIIKVTEGALRPNVTNWRSILFSCLVMASKVWDDLSMWNADFSHTCPAGVEFELARINELEIAVLSSLQYKVKVPASEYAKYYFLLRSMLIKSGLGSEDLKSMNPLDVEGAKQLQHVSSQYQSSVATMSERRQAAMSRSKTTGSSNIAYSSSISTENLSDSSHSVTPSISPLVESKHHCKVGLEHMVQL